MMYCARQEHFDFDTTCTGTQLVEHDHCTNVGRPQVARRPSSLNPVKGVRRKNGTNFDSVFFIVPFLCLISFIFLYFYLFSCS